MDIIKGIASLVISPIVFLFLLFSLSFLLSYYKRYRSSKITLILCFIIMVVSSQPFTANLLLYPLEFNELYQKFELKEGEDFDLIFVPGCYYTTIGDIPEVSRFHECSLQRLVEALRLWQRNKEAVIIVTGGMFEDEDKNFASRSRDLLVSLGANPESVIAVDQGTTTQSEVDAITTLINNKQLVVVSSATHGLRLIDMLSPLCAKLFFSPVDFLSPGIITFELYRPSTHSIRAVNRALYEYLAIIKYKITSNELNY